MKTIDNDFRAQLGGEGLMTAEILYYRPDHPKLLQTFLWQTMDITPQYPRLAGFLDHWRREVKAIIHSIRVAHASEIGPREWRFADVELELDGRRLH